MFTGTVKLAQIDDYISPGQNCIQPKIMKEGVQPEKATVTLNDCLACSGCITSAESVLIEQMSINKLLQMIEKDKERPFVAIISPQVMIALSLKYERPPEVIFHILVNFFRQKLKALMVLDLWEGIEVSHQLEHLEFLQGKEKTLLCSQCPGWICYAEKTLTEPIVKLMSRIKSPQQILARIVKERIPNCLVLTVMPCYDKKLEAIRFDIEQGIKQVDITITTTEMVELFQKLTERTLGETSICSQPLKIDRLIYGEVPFGFVPNQTSNGHLEALLARLGADIIKRSEIKNSDFIEYEVSVGGKTLKMAKCYGFRNIQRIVQAVKKNKCEYKYVEIMACPGGCYSGGGQPKIQNYKPKEISERCEKVAQMKIISPVLASKEEILGQKGKFKAEYKVIEQTLTQAVMNW